MNDITALAQRMKAAAKQSAFSIRHSVGMEVAADSYDFIEMTTPANVLALVEALEKAQQYAKARDEENQSLMLTVGRLRVERESLESRTVTVKLPPRVDSSNVPFTAHTWNCCLDAVEKCLAAAGIQVIEGEGQ